MATKLQSIPIQSADFSLNMIEETCSKCMKQDQIFKHEPKRAVFISRGWGAGGMPFSVLYLNKNTFSKNYQSVQPPRREGQPMQFPTFGKEKLKTSTRTGGTSLNNKYKNARAMPTSVIPQLFVSHGWGPLGRK